jgi:uncharacterized protein (DUF2267 family)
VIAGETFFHPPKVIEKKPRQLLIELRILEKTGRSKKNQAFEKLNHTTMLFDFEKYAMKGNEFLHRLENNLRTSDRAHAARVLRSTLRVLRNHITFEESLQLLSQLPMAIKSVYVDGWRKGSHKKIKTVDDFLIEIIQEEGDAVFQDFRSKEDVIAGVRAVVDTMRLYVSAEEMEQALGTLPRSIREMVEDNL